MSFDPYYSLKEKKAFIGRGERPETHHPDSLWRSGIKAVSVGAVFFVNSQRPVNWNGSHSYRYDGAAAFDPSLALAKEQVEGRRVRGTSWIIEEIPCLIATNDHGSVVLVEVNTGCPLDGWIFDYSRRSSLGAVADTWSEQAAGRESAHVLLYSPKIKFECRCRKYRGRRWVGIICERCGAEVEGERCDRRPISVPSLKSQLLLPLRRWESKPDGQGLPLDWNSRPYYSSLWDLKPLFSHAGLLNTRLQDHHGSQELAKRLRELRGG